MAEQEIERNGPGLRQWASIEPGFSRTFGPETVPWDSERVVFITVWRHPMTLTPLISRNREKVSEINYRCSVHRLDCPADYTNYVQNGRKYNDNYALRMLANKYHSPHWLSQMSRLQSSTAQLFTHSEWRVDARNVQTSVRVSQMEGLHIGTGKKARSESNSTEIEITTRAYSERHALRRPARTQ